MLDLDRPDLAALKDSLKPATWERRVACAQQQAALVEAMALAIQEGATETAALARLAPKMPRSTFQHLRERYLEGGVARLINRRPAKTRMKLTPEMRLAICLARRVDPQVAVERIAEGVAAQCQVRIGLATIRRVLQAAGLNRRRGPPGRAAPVPEALQYAGAAFVQLADLQLGYSVALTEAVVALRHDLPVEDDGAAPAVVPDDGRDAHGHFTAASNQASRKGAGGLGPAFHSIALRRTQVDLHARKVVQETPDAIARKVRAVVALPLLTPTGKTIQLDDYRGGHGVAEFGGVAYQGDTLDRFLRDLKYLGAGDALMAFHAGFWQAHEPQPAEASALCLYVDGVSKPLWSQHFTKAGKVSVNGRVMPCLDQVLIHTGMGTPIYWSTFSGHASLVTQTLPLLAKLEALVGSDWMADKLVVIDGEGNAVGLFKQFAAQGRHFITILRDHQITRPEEVANLTAWAPYRDGEEVAEGHVCLTDSHDPKVPFQARVILLRRRRQTALTALVTNAPADAYDAPALVGAYFARWPRQEHRFRTFNQSTHFKQVHGYGKVLVQNITVLTRLDRLRATKDRLHARITRQEGDVTSAQRTLTKAKLRLNAAKARQVRHDDLLDDAAEHPRRAGAALQRRIETTRAERDRFSVADAAVREAEATLQTTQEKLDDLQAKLPKLGVEMAQLETRKQIYQADTELDQIMTVFKLGFALLCEAAMRLFFPDLRYSLHGLMRQILSLPGTKTIEGKIEHIRIHASPNREVMRAVEAACARANDLQLRRQGRIIHLSVDSAPYARIQRVNSTL